jgi:hypothetical protein
MQRVEEVVRLQKAGDAVVRPLLTRMAPSSACSASRLWGAALKGSASGEAVSGAVAAKRRAVVVMGEASLTRR